MWSDYYGEINTFMSSCNCLAWNPAFDEDVMIIVGCTQSQKLVGQPALDKAIEGAAAGAEEKPKED